MPERTTPSDDDLLRRIESGDEEAFTLLYRKHQRRLYRFAMQMSGSSSIADEVTQETFMVLIRQAGLFDPKRGSVSSYLFGIARNQVLRCLGRERPYVSMTQELTEETQGADSGTREPLVDQEDPLGNLTRQERIEKVREAVLVLPPLYREAVVLCDMEEMSYAEAAALAGCAVGTIRSRLHRGRSLLLRKLQAERHPKTGAARCMP